jgi:hypothetical protein
MKAETMVRPDIKPGVCRMPAEQYHASPGFSKSMLDTIAICPAMLEWSRKAPVDEEAKTAVNIGTAFHALLLEPEQFALDYVGEYVVPKGAISTVDDLKAALNAHDLKFPSAANKGALTKLLLDAYPNSPVADSLYAEWEKGINGRTVLSPAEWRKLHLMRESVMAHPTARKLVELPGPVEECHYFVDPTTGVLCRCRMDKRIPSLGVVWDLKTGADVSARGFSKSLHELRYFVQDPFYSDAHVHTCGPCNDFLFVTVSTTRDRARYAVHVRALPDDQRQIGREAYKLDLATVSECMRTGRWNGREEVSLPDWFLGQR